MLETNIVSEFANPSPHPAVTGWLDDHRRDTLYLSVITIGEIQQGIARLPESRRRQQLAAWLKETLLVVYANLILPVDATTMLRRGNLTAWLMRQSRRMPVMDALIAATALQHDLSLVTRNVSDFAGTGLGLVDPWSQKEPPEEGPEDDF